MPDLRAPPAPTTPAPTSEAGKTKSLNGSPNYQSQGQSRSGQQKVVGGLARLVVVSNRVGVPGDSAQRAGGLEGALRPVLQKNGGVWLGWSGKVAAGNELETRSVRHTSQNAFQGHYTGSPWWRAQSPPPDWREMSAVHGAVAVSWSSRFYFS